MADSKVTAVKAARNNRKVFKGTVVSTKMNKTVTVDVQRKFLHPIYKKQVISNKKYHVSDAKGECQVGDVVRFVETRPISKTVCYRILNIVTKSK